MFTTYIALLHKAKRNANYGVFFPDFPGLVSSGKSMNEALENAKEGLIFHIEGMQENGEPLPKPSSLDKIINNKEYKEATPAAVKIVIATGNTKRINISIDVSLLNEIDHAAKQAGRNRSQFLADAAKNMLA